MDWRMGAGAHSHMHVNSAMVNGGEGCREAVTINPPGCTLYLARNESVDSSLWVQFLSLRMMETVE